MDFLWHTTRLSNIRSIMKHGIKAKIPYQRKDNPKGVYLSDYMLNWMRNTTIDGSNGAVLKINVKGLELKKDRHTKEEEKESMGKDYYYAGDIEPSRIIEVLAETSRGHLQHINTSITDKSSMPIRIVALKGKGRVGCLMA